MRPDTARIFFALWPPDALAESLARFAQDAAKRGSGRPTRRETIHLTLAFLGDVAVSELPTLCALGERVRALPFSLTIDRCGYWQHNRVFWAGPAEVPDRLRDLHLQLQTALAESAYPIDPPARQYIPHITLVRRMPSAIDISSPPEGAVFPALEWQCTNFVLVRSVLSPMGPDYRILRKFSLG